MNKLKENKIKVIGCIIIAIVLVIGGNWIYKNKRVRFADDKMRQVICLELGKDKASHDVTYRDLEKIEELDIGAVGEFETIVDVAKCKNLKQLRVNVGITEKRAYYELFEKLENGLMYCPPINEQKLKKVQGDLGKILKRAKKLECFRFTNFNESCNITDFSFLREAKNIKEIGVSYANVEDYSVLETCNKLEDIDLWYSNIETVDSLLKLKNANRFVLTGTPLAENEKEIKRLKEAFPEAEIIVD